MQVYKFPISYKKAGSSREGPGVYGALEAFAATRPE